MSKTTMDVAVTTAPQQPDISYHPDEAKYHAQTEHRLAADPSLPHVSLPAGFPKKVEGPNIWEGKDWTSEEQWVYQLNKEELKEIKHAVAHFNGLNKPLGYIGRETFPLATLSSTLRGLAHELHSGHGFFVLRTIPIDKYLHHDLTVLYAGISSHVGSACGGQDSTSAVLAHIKDLSISHAHEKGGISNTAYTTEKQVFHTDTGDLIALIVIQTVAEGGVSCISSGGCVV